MTSHLPPNWSALLDAYGRTYYLNRNTNQTSWTLPTHGTAAPPPPSYPPNIYPGSTPYSGPGGHVPNQARHGHHGHNGGRVAGISGAAATAYGAGAAAYDAKHHNNGRHGHHETKGIMSALGVTGSHGHGHGKHSGGHHNGGHHSSHNAHGGAVAAAHTFSRPMTFVLKEKVLSLSGDSFSVKDDSGRTHYKVEGKLLSIRDKKVLCDSHGHKLYRMKESLISLRSRQQILDAKTGRAVVTLRQKSFVPLMGISTVLVWKGDSDHGTPWLSCKGSFLRKNFIISDASTGREVCSVKRKSFNLKNIIFEKDTYIAQVAAGVDSALMVFLVVAIDEVYRDDSSDHTSNSLIPSALGKLL
eukprot:Plantae.Rhodophyta-Hildenbrandia_rubra.ctg2352.p1 GENE.Plantae.Rhodophyta-Hildenbrandia_rubra.ctg2352~~Plantae.Rhodophyta-Hildenbrandia_rubra.ctg2352.p1  ORF type:complete len:357 (+),score=58.20 Plantae.Rhodophyta-Hildenbrandia_rubra.ctg2352:168-1238(+)